MRYNPPPNWPKPPEGWAPSAEWEPDPSWPSPPSGWQMWVEDEPAPSRPTSGLNRLGSTSDDSEYFGDDRAWSEDSGRLPSRDQLRDSAPAQPPAPTEVAPEDLSARHLGQRVTIKWDDEHSYQIGTIIAVSGDAAAITVKLDGLEAPVSFPRDAAQRGPADPRLYVWS